MDPSERSFRRLLASDPRNPNPENTSFQHMTNFPSNQVPNISSQPQFVPQPLNHSQYPQNSPPTHAMHNFNPFGGLGNFQQCRIFGSAGSPSSHGSDSTSPQPQRTEVDRAEESSDSSPNEVRRAVRVNYCEENLRLVSAWLKHSVDSVHGTDQSGESYWGNVAEEFNSNKPQGARTRSKGQLKSHWGKISAAVAKFSGVYGRLDFCSGENLMRCSWTESVLCSNQKTTKSHLR
ncbi:hypothetical protein HU200_064062 [Digitaria exilis]|uniref:Myb-like domain-containing protein n=1 Tax=Digitaria exilis TaxID=1010633 RepID=A0A835DUU5_9POAL|nr:hypothetical protein HU200_064062 [Digitaria exilis]